MIRDGKNTFDQFKEPEPEEVPILDDLPLKPDDAGYRDAAQAEEKKKMPLFPFLLLVILLVAVSAVFGYFYISQNKKFTEKLDRAQMLMRTQEQAFAELEAELAKTQQAFEEKDQSLDKLQTRFDEAKRGNIIRESRLESSLKKSKTEAEELKETHEETLSKLGDVRSESSKWQTVAKEDSQLRTKLLQKIEDLKSELDKSEARLVQVRGQLNSEINQNARLKNQINTLKSEKNRLMTEIKRLEADINALINTPPPPENN
jgi:chromosome segregation ATPase